MSSNAQKLLRYTGAKTTVWNGIEIIGGETIPNSGSIYTNGANGNGASASAALCTSVAKALYELLGDDENAYAVSYGNGNRYVAERHIKDANGIEAVEIASYSPTGTVCAGIIENGTISQITIGLGKRFGTVILEAMMSYLGQDSELEDVIISLSSNLYSEEEIKKLLAQASDNIYFRFKNEDVKLNIRDAGKIPLIKEASIVAGLYTAEDGDSHFIGKPSQATYLNNFTIGGTKAKKKKGVSISDFAGSYELDKTRKLSDKELSLVPELPSYIVVPNQAEKVCKMVDKTTNTNRPVRNILLTGPAGTGKTLISDIVAAGLNRPKVKMTGNVGMEMIDLTGTFVPATGTSSTDLPTIEDIEFDIKGSYKRITGKKMPRGVSQNEVINLLFEKQSEAGNGKDFVYVPSPLIQALKYGWVCECQEFNMMANAGVLTGLNAILEGGTIELPTGEVIRRHPEAVIIFTMNTNYEGCRPLNQSVLDRFPVKFDIPLPDDNEMVERISKVCECNNIAFIKVCLECYHSTITYLAEQGFNGVLGVRSLYDWIIASLVEEDMGEAAEYTLLNSAMPSLIEESERADIKDFIRNNIIAPNAMPL